MVKYGWDSFHGLKIVFNSPPMRQLSFSPADNFPTLLKVTWDGPRMYPMISFELVSTHDYFVVTRYNA